MANGPEEFFDKKKAEAEGRRSESRQYTGGRLEELRDRAVSKAFAREPEAGEQVVKGSGGYTYYFNPETQSVYIAEAPGGKGVGTTMDSSTRNQSAYKAILAEIGPKVTDAINVDKAGPPPPRSTTFGKGETDLAGVFDETPPSPFTEGYSESEPSDYLGMLQKYAKDPQRPTANEYQDIMRRLDMSRR